MIELERIFKIHFINLFSSKSKFENQAHRKIIITDDFL